MNTKRQAKIDWMKQIVTILDKILEKNQISQEFVNCEPGEKFFDDSIKFSNLTHEIFELSWTLKNMIKYSTIIVESEN